MTAEDRIGRLEAELAESRAEVRRLTETLRMMCEAQARQAVIEAESKSARRARNVRHRAKTSTETSHETRTETSQTPPPLNSTPSSPAPLSPPPLSPPPPEKPSASADAQPVGQSDLLPGEAPAQKPKATRKQPDSEHHALWRALEAEYERTMGHRYAVANAGQDATAVKWLRETAKAAPEECVRRWRNLLTWSKEGFPTVTGFGTLRQHWNAPQVAGSAGKASKGPTMGDPDHWRDFIEADKTALAESKGEAA